MGIRILDIDACHISRIFSGQWFRIVKNPLPEDLQVLNAAVYDPDGRIRLILESDTWPTAPYPTPLDGMVWRTRPAPLPGEAEYSDPAAEG